MISCNLLRFSVLLNLICVHLLCGVVSYVSICLAILFFFWVVFIYWIVCSVIFISFSCLVKCDLIFMATMSLMIHFYLFLTLVSPYLRIKEWQNIFYYLHFPNKQDFLVVLTFPFKCLDRVKFNLSASL